MAKHYRWPNTCEECPLHDECDADDLVMDCPLIVRYAGHYIDWSANGWPAPNPLREGDVSNMPHELRESWHRVCGHMEKSEALGRWLRKHGRGYHD